MTTAIQRSFAGGEIAPVIYSRVDTNKHASGCKTLRNNIVTRSGGMMNRSGTQFAGEIKDSTKTSRLIPFQFSNSNSYVIELGDLYARFYQNGNQVLEFSTTITGITNASPGVVTDTAHGYSDGDEVYISSITGAIGTYLNNRNFKVVYIGANSYSLKYMDGTAVNTTSLGAYTSGGTAKRVYTITTIYPYNILADIKFVQSGDVITMAHPNYPPQQLTRTATIANGINTWTIATMLFNPLTIGPLNGSTVTVNEVQQGGAGYWTAGTATAGSCRLSLNGTNSTDLAYNASNATIQGVVTTMVTAAYGGGAVCTVVNQFTGLNAIQFTFSGTLAATDVPLITSINPSSGNFFTNGFAITYPNFTEVTKGAASTGSAGSNNYKYKVTSIDKVTGEESLPGVMGSVSITAVTTRGTQGTLCKITAASHGLSSGDEVVLNGMTSSGVPELANGRYIVTVLDVNNFILNNIDSTTFGVYTSGATMSYTFISATSKATPTPGSPITVNTGTVAASVGLVNVYKQINGVYGYVGTVQPGGLFLDKNVAPDVTINPPQFQTLFSTFNNYPSCVTYYQQRLCFANTNTYPMGFWASKTGNFNNFNIVTPGIPVADDDAIFFKLSSEKVDPIKNIANVGNLIIFTENNEYAILGNNTGGQYGTLTPTTINATIQSRHGASSLRPVVVQGSLVYLQARQSILRDLLYQISEDKYKGNDLTTFSTHLFDPYTIVDMDYQQIPNSLVWAVRSDGELLSMTYNKEQEIFAWSKHDTSGTFENVCVIPEGNADAVYVIAKRLVITNSVSRYARYVERLAPRNVEVSDVTRSIFMDCAGIFDGSNSAATSLRGTENVLKLQKGYSSAASNAVLNAGSPTKITIRGWIKLDGDNFNNGLATRSSLASSQGDWAFGFFTGNTNQLVFRCASAALTSSVVSKGIWHFVEASYDSSSLMRIYIDGVLDVSGSVSTVMSNTAVPLVIGNYYDTSMNYSFNGQMSEWEFCANKIRNTSNYTPPDTITVDSDTTVCYHLNDGIGSTIADSSGNSVTGTMYGTYVIGPPSMTISGGTNWTNVEQLTLTCSSAYFTSSMVGDDIRFDSADGTPIILTIKSYTSATVVKVTANKTVPVAYRSTAFTTWSRATSAISGLWYLENHAVSVLGNGYVLGSPYNLNYAQLVVHNGQITLPKNSSYVIVGCPYLSDFKTLDVDVVGYSVASGKTAIDRWKNISMVIPCVVNTRGGFCGTDSPEDVITNTAPDHLYNLFEIKPRNSLDTNPNLPPSLITDTIRVSVDGGSDHHGNIFVRQPDPLPFCMSQIAFGGDLPGREPDAAQPKGGSQNGQ